MGKYYQTPIFTIMVFIAAQFLFISVDFLIDHRGIQFVILSQKFFFTICRQYVCQALAQISNCLITHFSKVGRQCLCLITKGSFLQLLKLFFCKHKMQTHLVMCFFITVVFLQLLIILICFILFLSILFNKNKNYQSWTLKFRIVEDYEKSFACLIFLSF